MPFAVELDKLVHHLAGPRETNQSGGGAGVVFNAMQNICPQDTDPRISKSGAQCAFRVFGF